MALLSRCAVLLGALAWLAGCPSKMPEKDPHAEAEGLYLAGTAAFLQGRFDQALDFYKQVRALQPKDPRLPAAVGEVYLAQRKMQDALKEFEAAALADPRRSTNWSRIGYIHSVLGERAEAKTALRKALALNPQDASALEELAEIDKKEGEVDAAVGHFVLAAQASPEADKGALYLEAAQLLREKGRPEESLKLLQQARATGVQSADLLVELGDERVKAGDLAGAAEVYRQAAGRPPPDPTLWELVGEIEAKQKHRALAEEAFHQSLKVKERALPHIALARLSWDAHEKEVAETELERAMKAATGEERRETVELSDLLVAMGRKADALKLLVNLAGEPDSAKDADLQLLTARLAQQLGQKDVVRDACSRLSDAGTRCP
jgi:tetratricopeptide (TPR) repeat protein